MIPSNYITNWVDVVQHVLSEYPNEACGIVTTDNIFIPYANLHSDPKNFFELDSRALIEHDVRSIVHSHPYDLKTSNRHSRALAECPSVADQEGQIASGIEWGIVVTDGEGVDQPIWFGEYSHCADLMDRRFIPGAQDCLNFISDWMYLNKGVELPRKPHSEDWFVRGDDFMSEFFEDWGFRTVNTDLEVGDLVMFKIKSAVVNHLGVYVGDGNVAHHLFDRMPRVEQLGKWHGYIERIIRYKNDSANNQTIR